MGEELRSSPAELLALEEALLDFCEGSGHPGFLHFWESSHPFVVLGFSKKLIEETEVEQCRAAGVPILRRSSGGGTVLQGPGCFNYTLMLPIETAAEFETITSTNRAVMERHRAALEQALREPVRIRGCTDLAVGERKFCGNAQRRKRRCFLFHGSFLLGMDFSLMERLLRLPRHQPEYRQQRSHRDFLMNLEISRETVENALKSCWPEAELIERQESIPREVNERVQHLVNTKYGHEVWNLRF